MARLLGNMSRLEVRALIRFLWAKIVSACAMSRHVAKLCHSFQSGSQDVESRNMTGNGPPSSSTTEINPARIGEMIQNDRRVWGYAAKTNINILNTLQNSYIRMIVNACRYMKNDRIYKALKITSFKAHIQKLAINFFDNLPNTNNVNMLKLNDYNCNDNTKRPRRILLDSYNPP
ncbi:uncharacterized protein TNCV_1249511 [Trichonephila clavipes]|nr:uncharacterized protein TNCV_1249511 [Trichonephila clavipes]